MGRRAARHLPGRQALTRRALAALLLALLAGCSGGTDPQPPAVGPNPLAPLTAAISNVNAQRLQVLGAVDAVQRAATALDDVDAVCSTGQGPEARDALRKAKPLVEEARRQLVGLPAATARYRGGLGALGRQRVLVSGDGRAGVQAVVRDGRAEADAVARFQTTVTSLWPAYEQLLQLEDTWVTRAVTPWYRSDQEAAAAYTVLVDDSRARLEAARDQLAAVATAAVAASSTQSATLQAANSALDASPTPGPP